MYKFLTRNGQTIAFGIGLLITLLFLGIIFGGLEEFSAIPETDEKRFETGIFDFGIYAAIALVVVCAAAMLIFGVIQVASDPKGSLKGIIGLVAIIAVFFIAQATAGVDSESLDVIKKEFEVTPGQSSTISGFIGTALVMAGIAALTFVGSEIRNFFK